MNDTAVQATERTAVLDVLNDVYRAWADNDADALVASYIEESTSILPGSLSDGREAVRARFAAGFAGPLKGSSVLDEPLTVRFPSPDTAIVVSRSGVLLAGQTEPNRWVLATWVLTRGVTGWAIASYHNCEE
ncbi:SgcJ/EcaC family oxidoreductase [Nocardia sp. SYP-A9097]|uniref:SgcJ/EcaC family oxidoreductase n=1 Tax=Nocardia sp. SYP-A9097 TaxID=2663237 RepID=UPI00129AAEBE|nr:SgcJ/EcaC family oxidoreductase [Nocardia sp. SYP-A9097]MRH91496.1 SgcJ/EcaC family oxidoreductase [Nocardia sp. SYP-A9097]